MNVQQETADVDVVVTTHRDFFAQKSEPNSDEEQLDDRPFLSHQIAEDQESFSEKFLRNILTNDYQNRMPRRREKFVEIVKTVTVTEVVNGAPDNHPSSCQVKVTNFAPSGPHPINVSIKHLNEKWRSNESLEEKGTIIQIQETHQPYYQQQQQKENNSNLNMKRSSSASYREEETIRTKVEESRHRSSSSSHRTPLFNKSSDNIIDLEFTHPILIETNSPRTRAFADLRRQRVSKTTKLETTETEKVTKTTRKRSSSAAQPEVRTLYYRKFIDTNNESDGEEGGSMIDHMEDRSRSAEPTSRTTPPRPPPRKRLGREESLHYYRDDEEVQRDGVTSVSVNDSYDNRNITAGITTVSVNDSCTDTSFESRFSTIPRTSTHHIHVNVIGPKRSSTPSSAEDISIQIERQRRRRSSSETAPPKPPRRAKHTNVGEPLATSTPMTTIERKISRRPPDINIVAGDTENNVRSPARTPIVVVNQTPTSRRPSQDILSTTERRRKSTVTDIDWYAAFNMKEPSRLSVDDRREIPVRRRASESSIAIPPADIDLNQVFICTKIRRSDDEKCQCNACQLIRLSENERQSRSTTRQRTSSRVFNRTFSEYTTSTVPTRHSTPPVDIVLDDIFNPKPPAPTRKRLDDIFNNENHREDHIDQSKVRSVNKTTTTTNKSHVGSDKTIELLPQDGEIHTMTTLKMTSAVDEMMKSTRDWEETSRKPSKYIVTRKQRAQDVEALDFEKTSRRVEVTIPIIPTEPVTTSTRQEKMHTKTSTSEVTIQLNNEFNGTQQTSITTPSVTSTGHVIERTRTTPIEHQEEPASHITTSTMRLEDSERPDVPDFGHEVTTFINRTIDSRTGPDDETVHRPPPSPEEPSHIDSNVTSMSEVTIQLNNELIKLPESSHVVNLDDVFNVSFSGDDNDVSDEKLRQRIAEFEKNKADKQHHDEPITHVTTSSVQLEDSNIPIDDVFNVKSNIIAPQINVVIDPEPERQVTTSSVTLDDTHDETIHRPPPSPAEPRTEVNEAVPPSLSEITFHLNKNPNNEVTDHSSLPTENITTRSSPQQTSVNLDDVFNVSFTHNEDDVSDEKLKKRIAEFEKNKEDKKHHDEPIHVTTSSIHLEDSNIPIDDVFNLNKPVTVEPARQEETISRATTPVGNLDESTISIDDVYQLQSSSPTFSSESIPENNQVVPRAEISHQHLEPTTNVTTSVVKLDDSKIPIFDLRLPSVVPASSTSEVNLDDVFNVNFTHDEDDVSDQKLKQRIDEFEKNKADKKYQDEPRTDVTTSKINLDDSKISIDDVFDLKMPVINSPSVEYNFSLEDDTANNRDKSKIEHPTNRENMEVVDNFADSTATDIIDEIYDSGIVKDIQDVMLGKNQKPVQPSTSTVNLDDVFNVSSNPTEIENKHQEEPTHVTPSTVNLEESRPIHEVQISHEEAEPSEKPQIEPTSTLNLDDVFNVRFSGDDNDVSDEKLRRRIAEFEKNKADKQHHDEPITHGTTSNIHLEDSNIPIDDVFNVKSNIPAPQINVVIDSEPDAHVTTSSVTLDDTHDETIHRPPPSPAEPRTEVNEAVPLSLSEITFHLNKNPNNEVTDHSSLPTENITTRSSPQQTSVNLDDVFNVSFTHDENDVSDEKLKRRIAEFEKNKADKQYHDEPTHVTTSSIHLEDSKIPIDDVFNLNKPVTVEPTGPNQQHEFIPNLTQDESPIMMQEQETIHDILPQEDEPSESDQPSTSNALPDHPIDPIDEVIDLSPGIIFGQPTTSSINKIDNLEFEKNNQDEPTTHVTTSSVPLDNSWIDDIFKLNNPELPINRKESTGVASTSTLPTSQTSIDLGKESSGNAQSTLTEHPLNLDDVFDVSLRHDEREKNIKDNKKHRDESVTTSSINEPLPTDVPNNLESVTSKPTTSTSNLNLDDVFNVSFTHSEDDVSDEKLRQRIAEFEKNKEDKKHHDEPIHVTTSSIHLEDSNIPIDDVFNSNKSSTITTTSTKPDDQLIQSSTSAISLKDKKHQKEPTPVTTSSVNLDDLFNAASSTKTEHVSENNTEVAHVSTSNINVDDLTVPADNEVDCENQPEPTPSTSTLNLEDVFNVSFTHNEDDVSDEKLKRRIAEFEKNKEDKKHHDEPVTHVTTSSIHLEGSNIPIDDVFNLKTPTTIATTSTKLNDSPVDRPVIATSSMNSASSTETEVTHVSTSNINLNDLRSPAENVSDSEKLSIRPKKSEVTCEIQPEPTPSTSTSVNLDDVFNASFTHNEDDVSDEKLKRRIAEFEKNKEAKKHHDEPVTHVTTSSVNLNDSQISIDDVFNVKHPDLGKKTTSNDTPDPKFDDFYLSSINKDTSTTTTTTTTTKTTEETNEKTTTMTKRSGDYHSPSNEKQLRIVTEEKKEEIDLDSIYLSPPMSIPRSQKVRKDQDDPVSSPTRISQEIKYEWIADILSPTSTIVSSAFIDLGETSQQIESDQHPSTSSPILETTRTYHRSPRVSETVTTSHRWNNDAPLSPRRYSNFYEERKSISAAPPDHDHGDEDDEMYDEYNDFYISSVRNQEVDIDVSHFVDDILGKSLDEAAFLSSTKSLDFKKHTDTSIDRKKKNNQPEEEEQLMSLIFNESKSEEQFVKNEKQEQKSDEEMLEIEMNPEYFIVKGSYSLVIPKPDPLGQLLSKLSEEHELASLDFSLTRKLKAMLLECIKERATKEHRSEHPTISTRGQHLLSSVDNASTTFLKMNDNKYHYKKNPKGIINFCTAENNLCTALLEERFKHLELFIPNTEHLVRYPPSGGWPETRETLCAYFQHFMNARLEPEQLVLTASTRTAYDVVSHCLFEPQDILLTNGPIYTGTLSNPNERAQCVVECVPTDLKKPKLDISQFQNTYNNLTNEKDQIVSGVIIVNPHNPLGVAFPPEEVIELCNWASKLNLKVIIDEVFANCVFDKDSRFKSYLSYRHRVSRPENVTYMWSVSKDFGLPGLKFGVIHSTDESLKIAATKLQYYYPCSALVQDFTVKLLSDFDWLKTFHSEVQRRIRLHYIYTSENLKNLQIPFIPAQAGIFVFADFSQHLTELSESAELVFWNRLADEIGVMLTPGTHQKCDKFGWFRIVYACSAEELEEGFRRLYKFLRIRTKPLGAIDYLL